MCHNFSFISSGICSVGVRVFGDVLFVQPKMAILFLCSMLTLVEKQTGPPLYMGEDSLKPLGDKDSKSVFC